MIVENVDIYSLTPKQICDLIDKLREALSIVKCRKQTLSKVSLSEKIDIECPHCHSNSIIKKGFSKNRVQRYKCKECNKIFNNLTGTTFSKTHLSYEKIEIFFQCFRDKVSLRKTAERMDVDKNTVHLLRFKIIDMLGHIRKNIKLSGEIESDDFYKKINLKGTKENKMPRYSKPRKSSGTTTRGINSHKVCIASAIDENDNVFLEIVGTGEITSEMVSNALTSKLINVKKLITDCNSSYESIANKNNWNLIQVKSCGHTDEDGNSLANINSIHSDLSSFLACFRGVSTKHLQGYLDWYTFNKYLKYSINDNKQNDELFKESVNNSSIIKTSNMYNNYSGIDFNKVYSDYNYNLGTTN